MSSGIIWKCGIRIRTKYLPIGYASRRWVNAERYITQELKEYEEKIMGAQDKILVLETKLYNDLVLALAEFTPAIQINANLLARLDWLGCLLPKWHKTTVISVR